MFDVTTHDLNEDLDVRFFRLVVVLGCLMFSIIKGSLFYLWNG